MTPSESESADCSCGVRRVAEGISVVVLGDDGGSAVHAGSLGFVLQGLT